jgi:hypothetical protein
MTGEQIKELVASRFRNEGLTLRSIDVRAYPGETIVIVEVDQDFDRALEIARILDAEIESGFVTVRQFAGSLRPAVLVPLSGVHDARIVGLIELLSSRERASETQPSLRYVSDAEERINLAIAPRHHLLFGRRGVGKTALLLEAKRVVAAQGADTLWVNMHPLRSLDADTAFLTIAARLCDLGISVARSEQGAYRLLTDARGHVEQLLFQNNRPPNSTATLVPRIQQAISRLAVENGRAIYVFIDDIHYLDSREVPRLLDLLHGVSRDNPLWLKVAGIRHQTRWFIPHPPTGLQTGHDAAIINLDVTLEQPGRARAFLLDVLRGYVEQCQALPESRFLGSPAIDRLVLASGGVPRDFLSLCASALQIARQRSSARTVGVQDVNNAAGSAAQTKLQELEDDAAAERGGSQALVDALNVVRDFLINQKQITFLRIDFLDKENHPQEYSLMQALMDLRMLHLIHSSVSDPHHAGRRSEVYLLDLSQYSGTRLKQRLEVLDFEHDHLVLKKTRSNEPPRQGDTPRRLIELLRRGPVFDLLILSQRDNATV